MITNHFRHIIRRAKFIRRLYFNLIFLNINFLYNKKLFCRNLPLCEQKVFLRGSGKIIIGDSCSFGAKFGGFNRFGSIEFYPRFDNALISIGSNVATNNNIFISAANYVRIGNNTLIGQNVIIMDYEAHCVDPKRRRNLGTIGKVLIGKNVWIGNNVTILKNSSIGQNCIVAAGSVVSGNFPENVIIGGVPAKIIKNIDI